MPHHPVSGPAAQRGFSLVEAGIVLAVTAIVATSAAPSLQRVVDTRRIDGAATQLAADIQFVRTEAVARNQALRLGVQAGGGASCWVVHTGAANQCTCTADGPAQCSGGAQALKAVRLTGADRTVLQGNVASILFDPLHGTSTPTGTRRVSGNDGRAVHHVVNIMGRVRSCSPQAAVPGYRAC